VGIGDVVGVALALDDVAAELEVAEVVHAVASTPNASNVATITVRFRIGFPPRSTVRGMYAPGRLPGSGNR
jgi:hypothetical protein